MNVWDNPTVLDELERMRASKIDKGRLTFDCQNTVVKGDRVFCSKGHRLGHAVNGSMALIAVLRGFTAGVCRDCTDYEGGDNE